MIYHLRFDDDALLATDLASVSYSESSATALVLVLDRMTLVEDEATMVVVSSVSLLFAVLVFKRVTLVEDEASTTAVVPASSFSSRSAALVLDRTALALSRAALKVDRAALEVDRAALVGDDSETTPVVSSCSSRSAALDLGRVTLVEDEGTLVVVPALFSFAAFLCIVAAAGSADVSVVAVVST